MIPELTLDMRDETFTTQRELTAIINDKLAATNAEYGGCYLRRIVITPHQEKLLKLDLAERFVFRWKNVKHKYLDNIDGIPIVLADEDQTICENCGDIHG